MGQLNVVPHRLKFDAAKVEVVVAPTALHLGTVQGAITNPNVNVATQNLSLTGNGAFTGELSGAMVQDAGIKYAHIVIIVEDSIFCLHGGLSPSLDDFDQIN